MSLETATAKLAEADKAYTAASIVTIAAITAAKATAKAAKATTIAARAAAVAAVTAHALEQVEADKAYIAAKIITVAAAARVTRANAAVDEAEAVLITAVADEIAAGKAYTKATATN